MTLSILNQLRDAPSFFADKGIKIVAIGDIALDRTFLCHTPAPGSHNIGAGEEIFDIERDNHGSVGSANCTVLFCKSLGTRSLLVTMIGDDDEGNQVQQLLMRDGIENRCLVLSGVQTVTKWRFLLQNGPSGDYEFRFRADKDPEERDSYALAEEAIREPGFLDWLRDELIESDGILLNDTEKGFLSRSVVASFGTAIREANADRAQRGLTQLLVAVDPKRDWEKFRGLPIDVLMPNEREAALQVGMSDAHDFGADASLIALAERLYSRYGTHFPRIVVTLGRHGAALLEAGSDGAMLYRYPGFDATFPPPKRMKRRGDAASRLTAATCSPPRWYSAAPRVRTIKRL